MSAGSESTSGGAPCRHLPWDTEFFGMPVARVVGTGLGPDDAAAVQDWIRAKGIACTYFLNEPTDDGSIAAAREIGFRVVDERVELVRDLEAASLGANSGSETPTPSEPTATANAPLPGGIRIATAGEAEALAEMARDLHVDSRFFEDPKFPNAKARELYARWIDNAFASEQQAVLVGHAEGRPAGYMACAMEGGTEQQPEHVGRIGLIGVARFAQGAGLGSRLVEASLEWFQRRGARRVLVVTQGRNEAALALYRRTGFRVYTRGTWLHHWS